MILADTSVWIDHLRTGDEDLERLLDSATVLMHPFIVGELACGNLRDRSGVLRLLMHLPQAPVASQDEALFFIDESNLMGRGIGFVDVHLLAATAMARSSGLWTRDKRLGSVAAELDLAWDR
jgi:hypothetical protein